jgi:ankyrin repeat protein
VTQSSRSLPSHPDLSQQRKLAKELLRAFRDGESEAVARVRAQLPDKSRIVLADAQHVIAREYGFANWTELRRHIESSAGGSPASAFEAMRRAVLDGDAREMRRLFERHAELRNRINDPVFSYDSPALVHLSSRDDVALMDVLLEFGADPNRRSQWWAGSFHALHNASPAAAERLLAAGAVADACAAAHMDRLDLLGAIIDADPERVRERGGDGQTPLHFARSRAAVDLLLGAGADPDARDVDHRSTPAQWMLARRPGHGRYDLAKYLVQRGATPDVFLAAALGLTDRVVAMVRADPSLLDLRTTQGEYGEKPPSSYHIYMWTIGPDLSPLRVAAQFGQAETLAAMQANATPRQQLLAALSIGDARAARTLIDAHPGLLDSVTPADRSVLPEAGWAGNTRAVELMLDLGFDPLTPNAGGATALHCAAWEGAADCVAVILRHPRAAELVNVREPTYGATPFGWCCHGSVHAGRNKAHVAVAKLLLQAGAQPVPEPSAISDAVRAVVENWRNRP